MDSNILQYKRRGGTSNTHGPKFEMDFPCLTYIRCFKLYKNNKIKSFLIANNMDHVGAFDDVVCRIDYEENGSLQTRLVFIQLKHCSKSSSKQFSDYTFFHSMEQRNVKHRKEEVKIKMEESHGINKEDTEIKNESSKNVLCNLEMQKYIESYLLIRRIFNEIEVKDGSESSNEMNEARKQLKDVFNCQLNHCLFLYYTNAKRVERMRYFVPDVNMKIIKDIFDTSFETGVHKMRLESIKISDVLPEKHRHNNENEKLHINEFENFFYVFSNQEKQQSLEEVIKIEIKSYLKVSTQIVESIYAYLHDEFERLFRVYEGQFLTEEVDVVHKIHSLIKLQVPTTKLEEKYEKWLNLFSPITVENLYKDIIKLKNITIACNAINKNQAFIICIQLKEKIMENCKCVEDCKKSVTEQKQSVLFLYLENSISFEMWKSVRNLHNYTKHREVVLCVENKISKDVLDFISADEKSRELTISFDEIKPETHSRNVRKISQVAIEKLLNYEVKFQCLDSTLIEILGNLHYQEVFENIDNNGMFDTLVSRVLNKDDITIGCSLPEEEDIYIERKYKKNTYMLKYQAISDGRDMFLIYPKHSIPNSLDAVHLANVITFDNIKDALNYFKSSAGDNQGLHFCLAKESCIEVLFNKGNGANLAKFVIDQGEIDEEAFLQHILSNKCTILSDDVGMGKSTAMKRLTHCIKNKCKEYWVQYIDLPTQSKNLKTSKKVENPVDFIANDMLKLEYLNEMIFQHKCNTDGNVALFFDGFDEMNTEYRKEFIRLLKALSGTKIKIIVLATRTIVACELKVCLETFSFSLLGFSYEDMTSYLMQYWSFKGFNKQHWKLSQFVSNIVEHVKENRDTLTAVATVPLQTKMLALTYSDKIQNALSTEDLSTFYIGSLSLYSLYKNFIDMHIQRCIEEKQKHHESSIFYHIERVTYALESDKWEALACKEIFPSVEINEVSTIDTDLQKIQQIGIIVNKDPIKFVHRSFAEFLAAKYVSRMLYESKKTKLLNHIYKILSAEDEYVVLRKFMNAIYENERQWETAKINKKWSLGVFGFQVEDIVLMVSVQERNEFLFKVIFRHLFKNQNVLKRLLNYKNEYKESLLHISVKYCEQVFGDILNSIFFHCAKDCDKYRQTALHVACENGRDNAVKLYLNKFKSKSLSAIMEQTDNHWHTPMMWAARIGHTNIIKILIIQGASIHIKNEHEKNALMVASWKGHIDTVKYLIEQGAHINETCYLGMNALMYASENGCIETVKYLIEQGAHINEKDKLGRTVLGLACKNIHKYVDGVGCITYLVEQAGAVIDIRDNRGLTAVMHLIKNHDNIDILKCFIQLGADINALDSSGRNCVILAAEYGQIETVKYFIELGV